MQMVIYFGVNGSKMPKILFLNIYYESFMNKHYRDNPQLSDLGYVEMNHAIQETMFGDSDFYSHAMTKLGWDARDLIINDERLQKRWATDFGFQYESLSDIMIEQIRTMKPDVVYSQGVWVINQEVHDAIRPYVKIITGQVGFPLDNYAAPFYDVLFTTLPENVKQFVDAGTPAHYVPLAFDPRALEFEIDYVRYPLTFVGNLTGNHTKRMELLEVVSDHRRIDCWGNGYEELSQKMNIYHHGEAWGRDMFAIMRSSEMTLNCHIDSIAPYVGNMRMFEATGCGALLFTDDGANASDFFVNMQEVVYYQDPGHALKLINHYTFSMSSEAKIMARTGQWRTLANHTYDHRMKVVSEVLKEMM